MEKRKPNYSAKIANISRAMINEMWNIIEKRAQTDDRYQAPKRFLERTFESDHEICEVDGWNGKTYGVKGIRIEERLLLFRLRHRKHLRIADRPAPPTSTQGRINPHRLHRLHRL